jgi:hypothetical protein
MRGKKGNGDPLRPYPSSRINYRPYVRYDTNSTSELASTPIIPPTQSFSPSETDENHSVSVREKDKEAHKEHTPTVHDNNDKIHTNSEDTSAV